jgi:cerevisin
MRGLLSLTLLPMLASSAPTFNTDTIHHDAAPLIASSNSVEVPDSYIVVFKKHVSEKAASDHHSWVQDIHSQGEITRTELRKRSLLPDAAEIFKGLKHTYRIGAGFVGYSGHFDDSVIEKVRAHPDVSIPSSNTLCPHHCGHQAYRQNHLCYTRRAMND